MASSAALAVLLLLPLLLPSKLARAQGNVTLGSSLTAGDRNSWKSPSGDFAFGFQRIGAGSFLLAIWFDKIPENTGIWWVNGDKLAPQESKVELTDKGLVLSDPDGGNIWTLVLAGRVSNASMLDTGNFVLVNEAGSILWETFSQPTDTMVPTQTLDEGSKIFSRFSATSYSSGRFALMMQTDGNLVMYSPPISDPTNAYWASGTMGSSGCQVIFNQTGQIYLRNKSNAVLDTIFPGAAVSSVDFYQRAILEYDGVFRLYVHPRNGSSGWSTVSSPVPQNICTSVRRTLAGGVCGWNSYCFLGDGQRPSCNCPPGYSYIDPSNTMNGCQQDFLPQRCDKGAGDSNLFTFREMDNTDWPMSDYQRYDIQDEEFCRQVCLSDCFCAVVVFRDGICMKKRLPLLNGYFNGSAGGKALIKVRIHNSTSDKVSKDKNALILVGSVFLGCSVFANFILMAVIGLGFFLIFRKKLIRVIPNVADLDVNVRYFTYNELEDASNGFKEELGRGSFGIVYSGVIDMGEDPNSRTKVAIKKLDRMFQESEREFKTEVLVIGQTHHKNLVRLLGYCNEGQNRLLVYEFLSNGTLASFLFGNDMKASWDQRAQIALDIGKGLLYLHEECSTQIIHCDIKPQNILLDENYGARISDFGLAKLLLLTQSQTNTAVRGTRGYVAPEWFRNMPITVKVDVYSFGILLLEIICCRRSVDVEIEGEEKVILADWAYECYRERTVDALMENDEEALGDFKRLERFVMVAIWCIQEDPSLRPTMKKVMLMLEGIIQVPIPPCPFPFSTMTTV